MEIEATSLGTAQYQNSIENELVRCRRMMLHLHKCLNLVHENLQDGNAKLAQTLVKATLEDYEEEFRG